MLVIVYFLHAELTGNVMLAMIVDDDQAIRNLVDIMLHKAGYDVIHAEDGEQALTLLQHSKPDLVVTDVMMPGMSGIELCQHIRSHAKMTHTPVLLLSARSDEATIQAGMEAGANAYLTKPLAPSRLMAEISAFASQ